MDTTVMALANLFAALGGNPADVADITTIPEMINAIASHVSAGGTAELPAVEPTDDGKVLTVVSGKWAAAELPE